MRKYFFYLIYLGVATAAVLMLFELALRAFGLPRGYFHFRPLNDSTLYLPNRTLDVFLGPIPYTVKTNSLGFRGPEIGLKKTPGTLRIAALGDSVTDGFYVDNEDTYPVRLEAALRERGVRAEVVNAARGGASIGKEYEILRKLVMPLSPDVVVLLMDTNDLTDTLGTPLEDLLSCETPEFEPDSLSETLFAGRTALGELILDWNLRRRYPNYRRWERQPTAPADRYDIPGGAGFAENVRAFLDGRVQAGDQFVRAESLDTAHLATVSNYLEAVTSMKKFLAEHGCRLVFVYHPPYNRVYDPGAPHTVPDLLFAGCAERGIPALDLTPIFREAGKDKVLHLAPIDYHLNPEGNRVLAEAVAAFLIKEGLAAP